MKAKVVECKNGQKVEQYYDRAIKSYVTRILDSEGNQLGDAEHDGTKKGAKLSIQWLIKSCNEQP